MKNAEVRDEFTARGLRDAKLHLDLLQLPESERLAYESYQDDLHDQASMVESTYGIGKLEGIQMGKEAGKQEGRQAGKAETLTQLLQARFGVLPEWVQEWVNGATVEALDLWIGRIFFWRRSGPRCFSNPPSAAAWHPAEGCPPG
ncbi:MAG: hypothetical protein HQL98_11890 [Magnetococcales bacterium]|nr:hypothetical protein [Magnetococcales bacterium]